MVIDDQIGDEKLQYNINRCLGHMLITGTDLGCKKSW